MTDRPGIFRSEALVHRRRLDAAGSIIDAGPRWVGGAFWALLVLFVAAIVAASQIQITRHATGPTVVDDQGRLLVLIPSAVAPEVARGRPVELVEGTAEVVSSGQSVLDPSEIRARYGIDVTVPSVAVLTSADAGTGTTGASARVLVESENMIVALIPGLKVLFGGDDG